MRMLARVASLLAAGWLTSSLHGAENSSLASFNGDYSAGTTKISDGQATPVKGSAKVLFSTVSTGRQSKLKIHATIELPDDDRKLSSTVMFRRKHRARISNLAPGLDDGHIAEGTYHASPSRIHAEFPFVVGSATGRAVLDIRLIRRPPRLPDPGRSKTVLQRVQTSPSPGRSRLHPRIVMPCCFMYLPPRVGIARFANFVGLEKYDLRESFVRIDARGQRRGCSKSPGSRGLPTPARRGSRSR